MSKQPKIRYAVVGAGHIAQFAVLPAFKNARNAELVTVVSGDPEKREALAKRYDLAETYSYEQYDALLASKTIDAVFIALPNHLHREYTVRAAQAGVHVLCEKPMAVTEDDCRAMVDAAAAHQVKLMIAYRLHFEEANLKAIETVRAGEIGEPRLFNSVFSMNVARDNIRLKRETGGGTLYDIGVYCINAARYLFQAEPFEVMAFSAASKDPRFTEVDEITAGVLRFPGDRLASLTACFGAADVMNYQIVGSKGDLRVDPAFDYTSKLEHHLTIDGKTSKKSFAPRDQFAAEIEYFSTCIQEGADPEPSGKEGLADVRIVQALYRSAMSRQPVYMEPVSMSQRPTLEMEIKRPAIKKPPEVVNAAAPSQGPEE